MDSLKPAVEAGFYYLVISNRNELSQGKKKRSLLKGVSSRVQLKKQNQQKLYIKRFIARNWLM